MTLTIPVVEQY